MEITKREVITSVAIIAIMLTIGFLIGDKIEDHQNDKNAKYWKAEQISDKELFQYGIDTSSGNAFIYGTLQAEDPVTYKELGGKYMYIEKVEEHYTMHTRTVTTGSGKHRHTKVKHYWTWDLVGREDKTCKNLKFLGIQFDSKKVKMPGADYIETIKESSRIRYKYYGVKAEVKGTLFTKMSKGTISDKSDFYQNMEIEETIERLTSGEGKIIFWVVWIIMTVLAVIGFYYLDNKWLNT